MGCFQLLKALLLLRQIFFVITGIKPHFPVPYLGDLIDRDVKKITIVRDEHVSMGIVVEILLQPVARFQIEMVRWFVKQKKVRFFQKQLSQCNAHLPATGKFFRTAVPIFFSEPEPVEHHANFRFNVVTVA